MPTQYHIIDSTKGYSGDEDSRNSQSGYPTALGSEKHPSPRQANFDESPSFSLPSVGSAQQSLARLARYIQSVIAEKAGLPSLSLLLKQDLKHDRTF